MNCEINIKFKFQCPYIEHPYVHRLATAALACAGVLWQRLPEGPTESFTGELAEPLALSLDFGSDFLSLNSGSATYGVKPLQSFLSINDFLV